MITPLFVTSAMNNSVKIECVCLFALKQLNKLFNIVIIKMHVDKCGRSDDRKTPIYTGINIANLTNSF